jgi:hypothetical protein
MGTRKLAHHVATITVRRIPDRGLRRQRRRSNGSTSARLAFDNRISTIG